MKEKESIGRLTATGLTDKAVIRAGLFGSVARREGTEYSDVDVLGCEHSA